MKRLIFTVTTVVGLIATTNANAWFFFFIPGSVTQAVSDSVTGAKGNICVKDGLEVGHVFTSPQGNTAKIVSLSGTSSICQNQTTPIRAEVEFSYNFNSKAGIDLPDDFEPKSIPDLERFNGALLKAASKSQKNYGIEIWTHKKLENTDLEVMANNIENAVKRNLRLQDVTTANAEQLSINQMKAVRFEIAGTLKGVFGQSMKYQYTILEGDNERLVVAIYAPADYFSEHFDEISKFAFMVKGIKEATPQQSSDVRPATQPETTASVPPSTEERLATLNKLLRDGLLTQKEYAAKKKEILKGL